MRDRLPSGEERDTLRGKERGDRPRATDGKEGTMAMISVIATDSGRYNVIGTGEIGFCLRGNLTLAELVQLKTQVDDALREAGMALPPKKARRKAKS